MQISRDFPPQKKHCICLGWYQSPLQGHPQKVGSKLVGWKGNGFSPLFQEHREGWWNIRNGRQPFFWGFPSILDWSWDGSPTCWIMKKCFGLFWRHFFIVFVGWSNLIRKFGPGHFLFFFPLKIRVWVGVIFQGCPGKCGQWLIGQMMPCTAMFVHQRGNATKH